MEITYIGKRLNGDKLVCVYIKGDQLTSTEQLMFSKPIIPAVIGQIIECEEQPKGVKGPYKTLGRAKDVLITNWSIKEANAKQVADQRKAARLKPDSHVDALISEIKESCHNYSDRKRLALYVFEKLLA